MAEGAGVEKRDLARPALIGILRVLNRERAREALRSLFEVGLEGALRVLEEIADAYEFLPEVPKSRKIPQERITPKEMAACILGSYARLETIAERADMTPWGVRKYLDRHPELEPYMEYERMMIVDLALGKAVDLVKEGDGVMVRHILSSPIAKNMGLTGRPEEPDREVTIHLVYENPAPPKIGGDVIEGQTSLIADGDIAPIEEAGSAFGADGEADDA